MAGCVRQPRLLSVCGTDPAHNTDSSVNRHFSQSLSPAVCELRRSALTRDLKLERVALSRVKNSVELIFPDSLMALPERGARK